MTNAALMQLMWSNGTRQHLYILHQSTSNFSILNSNFFDPVLRERLYGNHPRLLPFEHWYKNQLKFQKKSLKHRKGLPRNNNDFFVNDLGIQKLGSCKFIEYDKFLKKSS